MVSSDLKNELDHVMTSRLEQKAYLHIGLPKTGSSSLQAFFRANGEQLGKNGICYPDTTGRDIGNATPAVLALAGPLPGYFVRNNPRFATGHHSFAALWRELRTAARWDQTLLISSEEIPSVSLRDFHDATNDGLDARVFLFVRRQDLALEASFLQEVKAGLVHCDFRDYVADAVECSNRERGVFDYAAFLEELTDFYGKDHIKVHVYDEPEDSNWIYRVTLDTLGLDFFPSYRIPQRLNESWHPLTAEYVRRLGGTYNPELLGCAQQVERDLRIKERVPCGLLSSEERTQLLAHFEHGNRWVAKEFGVGNGPTLFASAARREEPIFEPRSFEHLLEGLAKEINLRMSTDQQ